MKKNADGNSTLKKIHQEMEISRRLIREVTDAIALRIQAELDEIKNELNNLDIPDSPTGSQAKYVRDMLFLLDQLNTRPVRGKKKEIKHFEDLLDELNHLVIAYRKL